MNGYILSISISGLNTQYNDSFFEQTQYNDKTFKTTKNLTHRDKMCFNSKLFVRKVLN